MPQNPPLDGQTVTEPTMPQIMAAIDAFFNLIGSSRERMKAALMAARKAGYE